MSKSMHTKRGFARLTKAQRIAISTKGGKTAQAKGTGHRWSADEARLRGAEGAKSRWK